MKNTLNKQRAIIELNECLLNSSSYNEAIDKFFQSTICEWLEINPAYIPSEPQKAKWYDENGDKRVLPKNNLLNEALLYGFKSASASIMASKIALKNKLEK